MNMFDTKKIIFDKITAIFTLFFFIRILCKNSDSACIHGESTCTRAFAAGI